MVKRIVDGDDVRLLARMLIYGVLLMVISLYCALVFSLALKLAQLVLAN